MSYSVESGQVPGVATTEMERIADYMESGMVVYDNFAVFALVGNAHNMELQEMIRGIKGEARGVTQPVGWTRPFDERTLSSIDISQVEDARITELLRNPEELTARIGALSFLRAKADMRTKEAEAIPDCIISPEGQTVQLYSPVGARPTHLLLDLAINKGMEPVMTSANISGQPEIVSEAAAISFAANSKPVLPVALNKIDEDRADRPLGSYPVINVEPDRLRIVRAGNIAPDILMTALSGYPVELAPECQTSNYPSNILQFSDLPSGLQYLQGSEFRLGLLAHLGWSR